MVQISRYCGLSCAKGRLDKHWNNSHFEYLFIQPLHAQVDIVRRNIVEVIEYCVPGGD